MIKKMDKMLKTKKSLGLYNNLIAGIITGATVGSTIQYFINLIKSINIVGLVIYSIFVILVIFLGFYFGWVVIRNVAKDHSNLSSELFNYKSNFIAGLVSSIVASIIINLLQLNLFLILVLIPLITIGLVLIIYFFIKNNIT